MTCAKQLADLVEIARRGAQPDRDLRTHLATCPGCAERWKAEQRLTDQFRTMRLRADSLMADDTRRDDLMRTFAAQDFAGRRRWTSSNWMSARSWVFALGAAAAVVISILAGQTARMRLHPSPPGSFHARETQTVLYETSADASSLSTDDFIAVPYTPPLAQGELVRVVHADLYPEALASMGIDVDPAWTSDVPADVVVGEDGIPRAVRIIESAQ
jgi:hypothetical protein